MVWSVRISRRRVALHRLSCSTIPMIQRSVGRLLLNVFEFRNNVIRIFYQDTDAKSETAPKQVDFLLIEFEFEKEFLQYFFQSYLERRINRNSSCKF